MNTGDDNRAQLALRLSNELSYCCEYEILSEDGLLEIFERHGVTPDSNLDVSFEFFSSACRNPTATVGVIRLLMDYFPAAVSSIDEMGNLPLQSAIGTERDSISYENKGHLVPSTSIMDKTQTKLEIITLLLEKYPEAIQHESYMGNLALHVHVRSKEASVDILTLLLEKYPEAASHFNHDGNLPIHIAITRSSAAICRELIKSAPDCLHLIDKFDEYGHMALHIFCMEFRNLEHQKSSIEILLLLLEKCPQASHHADSDGNLPIHLAVMGGRHEICRVLINAAPDTLRIENRNGDLPLHLLASKKCFFDEEKTEIDILILMLEKYPNSIYHANAAGKLPIHMVVNNFDIYNADFFLQACHKASVTEGVIRLLMEYFPGAINRVDSMGRSALFHACSSKSLRLNVIKLLVEAAPDSVRIADTNKYLPLHIVCESHDKEETTVINVMKLLLKEYPESVWQVNGEGATPILLAITIMFNRSLSFCSVLLNAVPGTLYCPDVRGNIFLHILCEQVNIDEKKAIEILNLVLEKCPRAIQRANNEGCLPIHCAANARSLDFCCILLDFAPETICIVNDYGEMPLHVLCKRRNLMKGTSALEMLRAFVEKYPEAIHHADTDGNLPIHSAAYQGSLEFCRELLDFAPDTLPIENIHGDLPLTSLCLRRSLEEEKTAIEILMLFLEGYPEASRHESDGYLPIHWASRFRSTRFCSLLIETYAGSERIRSGEGLLPLHSACEDNTLSTIEYLYQLYPEAVNQATIHRYYPIHIALHFKRKHATSAVAAAQLLLGSHADVASQNLGRKSLLHYACKLLSEEDCACLEVIKIIYDAHPKAILGTRLRRNIRNFHPKVQSFLEGEILYALKARKINEMTTPNESGQLLLHQAVRRNVRLGTIILLVNGNPSATRHVDDNHALPLLLACRYHNSSSVIKHLVDHDPTALQQVDKNGNSSLHYACREAKYETIAMFVEKFDATSVWKRNFKEKLPIDLLFESDAVEDRESLEYINCVFLLLRAHPSFD